MFSSTEASTFQWESSVFVSPTKAPALMILDEYEAETAWRLRIEKNAKTGREEARLGGTVPSPRSTDTVLTGRGSPFRSFGKESGSP